MKSVRIKKYDVTIQGYKLYLGNGTVHTFSNKKQLDSFIAKANKFLSQQLIQVNQYLVDIYQRYRTLQHYFQTGLNETDVQLCESIKSNLRYVEDQYDRLVTLGHCFENGNYYAFQWIGTMLIYLRDTLQKLIDVYNRRTMYAQVYECKNIIQHINTTRASLDNYGTETATSSFIPNLQNIA